jgi:hypothetical protein
MERIGGRYGPFLRIGASPQASGTEVEQRFLVI